MKFLIQYAEFSPSGGIKVGNRIFEGSIVEISARNPNMAILDAIDISNDEIKMYEKIIGKDSVSPNPAPVKKVRSTK